MRVTGCVYKNERGHWWYVFEGDKVIYTSWDKSKPDSSEAVRWGYAITRWGARWALKRTMRYHLRLRDHLRMRYHLRKPGGVEIYKGEIKDGEVNVQRG
jgi:hypothetical protein